MNLSTLIGSCRGSLTSNQQKIADFVLANPFAVATMGIEELAQATSTSSATITRFVRALGLGSFTDFRGLAVQGYQSLLRPVEMSTAPVTSRPEKLRRTPSRVRRKACGRL